MLKVMLLMWQFCHGTADCHLHIAPDEPQHGSTLVLVYSPSRDHILECVVRNVATATCRTVEVGDA